MQPRRSPVTGALSPAVQRGAIALAGLRNACARRDLSVAGWSILHAPGDRIVSVRRDRSQRRYSSRLRRAAVARAGRLFGLAAYISALMYLHVTQSFWLVLVAVIAAVAVFSL